MAATASGFVQLRGVTIDHPCGTGSRSEGRRNRVVAGRDRIPSGAKALFIPLALSASAAAESRALILAAASRPESSFSAACKAHSFIRFIGIRRSGKSCPDTKPAEIEIFRSL
jgi:hypothetical protein